MKKIGIFYGSNSGNTESIANRLQNLLGADNADVINIANAKTDDFIRYENLIFGTSTWGLGDLQDDWESFLPNLKKIDFAGKKVALFGVGDSMGYADTFVDGMGELYQAIQDSGYVVGFTPVTGYYFDASKAQVDDQFVGLALDEDNESDKTIERLTAWVENLKLQFTI
ncbi:MAG: flavodoxin [Bacteroidales bacterium]|jgi:flavodoxin I|nr:flavodoxin [Bacteroidales bacterium]